MASRVLPLVFMGSPVLRAAAKPIPKSVFASGEIARLAGDMFATMESSNAVGLAAPQIGETLRMFVMDAPYERAKRKAKKCDEDGATPSIRRVVCNPRVVQASSDEEFGLEGCLSIPGLLAFVPRSHQISVRFHDEHGKEEEMDLEGFPARVFLHELDHLDGVLMTERIRTTRHLLMDSEIETFFEALEQDAPAKNAVYGKVATQVLL